MQYQYVSECRNSGLTDREWCEENGINIHTFYSWVNRIRNSSDMVIPESTAADEDAIKKHQDVVKVDILSDIMVRNGSTEPVSSHRSTDVSGYSIEICLPTGTVKFSNSADPQLAACILRSMRGTL